MLAKRYNVVQMRQFFSSKSCVRLLSLPMRGEWIEIIPSYGDLEQAMSLPMRGEWIEITHFGRMAVSFESLPMRGEWIEIQCARQKRATDYRLSPCGESGLKSPLMDLPLYPPSGLSPCGESGLKYIGGEKLDEIFKSLPMRGEWIEIDTGSGLTAGSLVSPHAGRVD